MIRGIIASALLIPCVIGLIGTFIYGVMTDNSAHWEDKTETRRCAKKLKVYMRLLLVSIVLAHIVVWI